MPQVPQLEPLQPQMVTVLSRPYLCTRSYVTVARPKASSNLGVLHIVHHGPLYVYLQKFAALTQQGRNSLQAAIIPLILISNAIDVGVGLLQALNPVVGPTSR